MAWVIENRFTMNGETLKTHSVETFASLVGGGCGARPCGTMSPLNVRPQRRAASQLAEGMSW